MTVLPSNSVFISYRKDDSAGWSANLARELRTRLGNSAVFIDDSTGIPYGSQWPDQIAMALDQCRVFLPVIAPSWHQEENISRLKEPDDWVRQELIAAHRRRHSVLCIPVFVNESPILTIDQFSDDAELQTVLGDLMTDQGIRLDRSTEHWPAKIDQLISRIESHLGISTLSSGSNIDKEIKENVASDLVQGPSVIQWLCANQPAVCTVAGVVVVVAAVTALYQFSDELLPDPNNKTFHIEGDFQGDTVAGDKIVQNRDPKDVETIVSMQRTIDKLVSRWPEADEQSREAIADAVASLPETDSDPSDIKRAEQALEDGDTELAKVLYRVDAEKKQEAGEGQLQDAAASYRRLGVLAFLDDTPAALEAFEKAVNAWPNDIDAWNQLGHLYYRIGQLDKSINAYERVGKLANYSYELQKWTAISFGNLGNVFHAKGDLDQAIELHERSLAIEESLGRREGVANQYGNLGNIYQTKGNLNRAIELHEQSLAINQELGRMEGMANDYDNLGIVYRIRGDLDRAIELHEQSLMINHELGRNEGMAGNYSNMGIVYYTKGDLDRAIELYEQSLAIDLELGRKQGVARNYGNLGIAYRLKGDSDRAIELYEQSLAIDNALGNKQGMASNYSNLGTIYYIKGDVDRAIELYEKSLTINQSLGRKQGIASDFGNLGIVYRMKGDFKLARLLWQQAADLFDAIGSPNGEKVRVWMSELDAL